MHCHPSFDNAVSPRHTSFSLTNRLQIGGAVLTAWRLGRRNRAGAGAGATPVFVAMLRHDPSLIRWLSLMGPSRTCPSSSITNRDAILTQTTFITKE